MYLSQMSIGSSTCPSASITLYWRAMGISFLERLALQPKVLERRRVGERRDQLQPGFLDVRPEGPDEPVFPDRREDHALVQEPLDLEQRLLALLAVQLLQLGLKEALDLRDRAVGQGAPAGRDGLEARRGIAGRARRADEEPPQLLVPPGREQRSALHRPHAGPDAHSGQVVRDGLAHRIVRRERRELA